MKSPWYVGFALRRRLSVISQHPFNRKRTRRSGQVMIMFTMMLIPMFGMLGLVADVGYMHFIKESAQTAAESAAQAAVVNMHSTLGGAITSCSTTGVICASSPTSCTANITTPANSAEVGCMYAQAHGFNSTNQWVTYQSGINSTPPTAAGSGSSNYWITYRVIQKVPQMFSAILGDMSGMVASRSTAAIQGATDCIYALNPNQSGAISVGGTAALTSACGVYDNSSDPCALSTNGGGAITAPEYDVVGNACTHAPLTPAANSGVSHITDPLAGLAAPASAPYTCDVKNYNTNKSDTITAGVYCGGIQVQKGTLTLSAGTYILVGGGIYTQDANANITGTGVTIYNTYNSVTNPYNGSFSGLNIAAGSTVTLSAPDSGTYSGILYFEDRTAPASNDSFGGNSSSYYQGTIYAKNAAISMYGTSSVLAKYTILVADTISIVGTAGFNNDYSSLPNSSSPLQKILMVE
jgi:Flp pilus assembly protein TadG